MVKFIFCFFDKNLSKSNMLVYLYYFVTLMGLITGVVLLLDPPKLLCFNNFFLISHCSIATILGMMVLLPVAFLYSLLTVWCVRRRHVKHIIDNLLEHY